MKPPRLCYIHIPKTAGTAVTDALRAIYPAEKIFGATFMYEYVSVDPAVFENYLLYKGHVHYSFAVKNFPKDTKYITVLRDPVERIISLYFYVRNYPEDILIDPNVPDHQKEGVRLAKEKGIVEYLSSSLPDVIHSTRNHQLMVLVGKQAFARVYTDPEYVIDKAWSNISRFFCYGIQELLPQFIEALAEKLGGVDLPLKEVNPTPQKSRHMEMISEKELQWAKELIKEHNLAEIMLYERVKQSIISRLNNTGVL